MKCGQSGLHVQTRSMVFVAPSGIILSSSENLGYDDNGSHKSKVEGTDIMGMVRYIVVQSPGRHTRSNGVNRQCLRE